MLPSIQKTGGYSVAGAQDFEELHDLLKRSERSLKFLTTKRDYLSRENRLLRENIKLRDRLDKKNTPLTAGEKGRAAENGVRKTELCSRPPEILLTQNSQ